MRGDFMADLLIVRMDSWSSWLAGIATCNGDYFHTFLLIPTFSWTTTHDHQRQTVYRLLYTLCDVGTWFHSNPVRLSFSETSWECKGFMQFHLRPLFSGYPYRTNFDLCQGVSSPDFPSGYFRVYSDTERLVNTYEHLSRLCNHF